MKKQSTPQYQCAPRSRLGLIRQGLLGTLMVCAIIATTIAPPQSAEACMGFTRPVCSRSTVLIKAAPVVIVLPPGGGPVTAPIPVTVFVNSAGPCSLPISTTISLTATCTPPPGGTGTITIPTPLPGFYPVLVPMTFAAGPPRVCTITGTATTTWGGGAITIGAGDTVICLVEEAPDLPGEPRLDLELLTPESQTVHPGDQVSDRYRLTNNDPDHSVTVTISADSEQAARLSGGGGDPPGSGSGPVALADPGDGDNFPIAFLEDLVPDPGPGNNYILDDGTQEDQLGLDSDGSLLWLNQFDVVPGQQFITKVSVAYGPGADGKRVSVLVYDDPNNDGDPADAVLLTQTDDVAANENTGIYNETTIVPTFVGTPGDSFFVGVVMQEADAFDFPAALDEDSDAGRSWIAASLPQCRLDTRDLPSNDVPPTLTADVGFPGNFMIRAKGDLEPRLGWIELPPDPMAFGVPTITREITLCPGEIREFEIASRSWPMCRSGSCSEKRVILTGSYSNGDDALACAGAAHIVDTDVPPNYDCPDGGIYLDPVQKDNGLLFVGDMPSHFVEDCVRVEFTEVFVPDGPGVIPGEIFSDVLDKDTGRIAARNFGDDGPAVLIGQPFEVFAILQMEPLDTGTFQTEMISLSLHGPSPVLPQPINFSIDVRSRMTGGTIPPDLDTFVSRFMMISVDGVTGGLHRNANIQESSINVEILDPITLQVNFQALFPPDPDLPPQIDEIRVLFDGGDVATGILFADEPDCPEDLNGDGTIDLADLGILLASYEVDDGGDIDGDGDTDLADLGALLALFGQPCP